MTLVAPFASVDKMLSSATMKALADRVVRRESGATFLAQGSTSDKVLFDGVALAADMRLRYLIEDAADLAPGERIEVDGLPYEVHGDPRRVNPHECVAQLMEAD